MSQEGMLSSTPLFGLFGFSLRLFRDGNSFISFFTEPFTSASWRPFIFSSSAIASTA
jgi:hypothetical protein